MEAYFTINEYKDIPIIPEINYNDLMDGSPDNMPFSFIYDEDLSKKIKLKDKCIVRLEDEYYNKVLSGNINDSIYTINNIEYTYLNSELILNNISVASVYDNEIIFYESNDKYVIDDNDIYKDNRKYYYLCVSQITSEKMSTNYENGYMITVLLKEQTILLKDCVRTDIAISPSLYPDGSHVFDNLYDATLKVIDCHNMCLLNDTITGIDGDINDENSLVGALSKIPCPNLTYRDLSTYSQLYDIFMRIGRIPYYSNGTIYGIKLEGERKDTIKDLSSYSSVSNIVEEGVNDNIYSSKIYNNLYDKEYAIVPNIFSDLVNGYEEQIYSDGDYSPAQDTLDNELNVFLKSNVTSTEAFVATSASNLNKQMDDWINTQYAEWKRMKYDSSEDISKCLLFVNGFDERSSAIEDARSYNIELPYPIERVESIYICKPRILKVNNGKSFNDKWLGTAHFGFALQKIYDFNDNSFGNVIENTYYEQLSSLQKATFAYYVRGGNKINSIISIVPFATSLEEQYKQNGFSWSSSVLYNELKKSYFVVKYKPILNTTYTNYEYVKDLGETKPLSVNNFNLPYSQVSDKQVYPILDYNLKKGLDDTYNIKVITTDSSILDVSAGDIVKYQGVEYIVSKMQSYINNKTIECSFELNDKIIQNSILSSYKDNVRVSSNISAETTVDRPIHIFAENVVELFDGLAHPEDYPKYNNIEDYNIFTQRIGQNMINATFYKNGLYEDIDVYNDKLVDAYGNLSNYPLRFSQIVPENITNTTGTTISINTTRGLEYGNNPQYQDYYYKHTFKSSDFPIAVCIHMYVTAGININENETYYVKYIVNNPTELANVIPLIGAYYYRYSLVPTPYSYVSASFITNADNVTVGQTKYKNNPLVYGDLDIDNFTYYDIRPPYGGSFEDGDWNVEKILVYKFFEANRTEEFKLIGNYSIYDTSNPFESSLYGTEKFISNTGLITKLDYCMANSSYANSVFNQENDPRLSISSTSDGKATLYTIDASIKQQTPLRYNSTKYGCILEGIGKTSGKDPETGIDNFYSFSRLPHLSNKGYYLDLRENPRPYIQYITRGIGTGGLVVKELSNEFEWMSTVTSYTQPSPFKKGAIYKIPKFTTLSNYQINDNDKIADITYFNKMSDNNGKLTMGLNNVVIYNPNSDYCLVLTKDNGEKTKLIKFNLKEYGYAIGALGISSTIHSNYD